MIFADPASLSGKLMRRDGFTSQHDFGQPEIQNLRVSTPGDEDVGRFNIAVNYAFGVSGFKSLRHFNRNFKQALEVHRPARDHILEGRSIKILHGDEGLALMLADLIDGANVGMLQRRGRTSLTAKSL